MGLLDLIGHKYPFTDFHELNLDWCITAVLQLQKAFEDFSAGNKLIFANPLQHDLTKTYAKNTIVVDSVSGTAYLSLEAVPVGVQLDNASYWLPVFDFAGYVTRANQNFTDNYFSGTDRAPIALSVGDWVVLDDVLYKVTQAIAADDLFEIGTNIVHFTVEQFLKDFITSVTQTITDWRDEMVRTINQYKDDIDASELAYRNQVAHDVSQITESMQAQLDLAISGVTVDSEVINARLGWDGVTYGTLGDAIRTQLSNLNDILYTTLTYTNGGIRTSGVIDPALTSYWYSNLIACLPKDTIKYVAKSTSTNIAGIAFYDINQNFIGCLDNNASADNDEVTATTPDNCYYVRITISNTQYTNNKGYINIVSKSERDSFIKKYADTATRTELYKDNLSVESTVAQFSNTELRKFANIYDNVGIIEIRNSDPLLRYSWVLLDSSNTQIASSPWRTSTEIVDLFNYPLVAGLRIRIQHTDQSDIDISEAVSVTASRKAVMQYTNEIINGNIIFVDGTNGNDTNNGRTRSTAKKTIANALLFKPNRILVASGTYEPFVIDGLSDLYIGNDRYYDTYTAGVSEDNPHIIIDGQSTESKGIEIKNCNNVTLDSLEVCNCTTQGIIVTRSQSVKIVNCISHDIYNSDMDGDALGIASRYSDLDCIDCLVYNIGINTTGTGNTHSDGFNFHNTGVCNLYNCRAYNCDDDGVSHHDATVGFIENGEFSYCGKAGIASPAAGATVNVSNVYCHHSKEGLYAANSVDTKVQPNILIFNSVFKDNTLTDIYSDNFYHLILANCIYDNISATNVTIY